MAERARPRIWWDGADFRYVADREHRAGLYRGDTVADCTTVHDDEPVDLVELIDGPPPGLPAVLSSVDDVARVCEAAGLPEVTSAEALAAIAQQPKDSTVPITRTWQDKDLRVSARRSFFFLQVKVEAFDGGAWSGDGRQLRLAVLWSAIQAARGGEPG